MIDIHVKAGDTALKDTFLEGLNITVRELEMYIFEEARNQQLLFAQRMVQQKVQFVDAKYADPKYWLDYVANVYASRIEWETAKTSEGVLFRISKVKDFTPRTLQ